MAVQPPAGLTLARTTGYPRGDPTSQQVSRRGPRAVGPRLTRKGTLVTRSTVLDGAVVARAGACGAVTTSGCSQARAMASQIAVDSRAPVTTAAAQCVSHCPTPPAVPVRYAVNAVS